MCASCALTRAVSARERVVRHVLGRLGWHSLRDGRAAHVGGHGPDSVVFFPLYAIHRVKKTLPHCSTTRPCPRVHPVPVRVSCVRVRFLSSPASRAATSLRRSLTSGIRAGCGQGIDRGEVSSLESSPRDRVGDDRHSAVIAEGRREEDRKVR